jgi:starch phosphorylase
MKVARELVQSCDIWLNTPRRGEEACGTSGMKAAMNGVLNLSILDGWFDEAYEESGGWAIGDREPYSDEQENMHASAIYYLLENEIVPMFYERRDHGTQEWMRRVKQSLRYLSPEFDARRMLREYDHELYAPAHLAFSAQMQSRFDSARRRVKWSGKVREVWDRVHFVETGPAPAGPVTSGITVPVRATVDLAGLDPEDVRVELVMGRVGASGSLEETEVMVLPVVERNGTTAIFAKEIAPQQTGRLGYALRISPNHYDDPLTRPCTSLLKWGGHSG